MATKKQSPPRNILRKEFLIRGIREFKEPGVLVTFEETPEDIIAHIEHVVVDRQQMDESGDGALTRQGLEEYVSDCVVLLDHRVNGQISTRRLRVVKYRGSLMAPMSFPS